MDKLIMSRKEREQLTVFKRLAAGEITQVAAAQSLRISTRWIRKKYQRYQAMGDSGLLHQSRGRISHKRWDEKERELTIACSNLIGMNLVPLLPLKN